MKTKTLAGVASGILLTASVVVAYVQHAATTFTSIKSNRGRHSIQIAASGNSNTDLSSLLESAKNDFGGTTVTAKATVTSKIVDVAKSAATTPTADLPTISDPVNKILKVTQETVQQGKVPILHTVPPEAGKALPLGNFIKSNMVNGLPDATPSTWDTAKENLGRLGSNLVKMTVKDPSELSPMHSNDVDIHGIGQHVQHLPDVTKAWIALATGTSLVILGANKNKTASKKEKVTEKDVQAASDAIVGLTDELVRSFLQ